MKKNEVKEEVLEGTEGKEAARTKVMKQILKRYGEGSIMKLGDESHIQIDAIPTGSLSLDVALGIGGVPKGRIIEIYGPESSGKTTLALHIAAEAQKAGGYAAFIDAEHALDPVYAKALGVDINELLEILPSIDVESTEKLLDFVQFFHA